jgi:S-adenosylhomocysteine hydrolase
MINQLAEDDFRFLAEFHAGLEWPKQERRPWLMKIGMGGKLPTGWGFVDADTAHSSFASDLMNRLRIEKRKNALLRHIEALTEIATEQPATDARLRAIHQQLDAVYIAEARERAAEPSTTRQAAADFNGIPEEEIFRFAPLLKQYSQDSELKRKQPFAGKRTILVLHFLRDLLPFMSAMEQLGLNPARATIFYKRLYGYPHRDAVERWLRDRKYDVRSDEHIDDFYHELVSSPSPREPLLVVEDGGYFAPKLAKEADPSVVRSLVGVVEQTTNGITRLKDALAGATAPFPLLSIPDSEIKREVEPPLIGRATTHTLQNMLTGVALAGQHVGLIGYGSIGMQVAEALKSQGVAEVKVFDLKPEKLSAARTRGCVAVNTVEEAARNSFLLLGGSGNKSITKSVVDVLANGAFVASTSSRTVEIDLEELDSFTTSRSTEQRRGDHPIGTRHQLKNGKAVVVLANGTPLNFWNTEGMPDQFGDLIMTLIFLAAAELAAGNYKMPGINQKAVNEIASAHHVAKAFLKAWWG